MVDERPGKMKSHMTNDLLPISGDQITIAESGGVADITLDVMPAPPVHSVGDALASAGISIGDLVDRDPAMEHLTEVQAQTTREALERFAAHDAMNHPTYCPHCGTHLKG